MNLKVGVLGYARCIRFNLLTKEVEVDTGWIKNTFVNVGKAYVAQLLKDPTSVNAMEYIAVGSSSNAESDTETSLVSEITGNGLERSQATKSIATTTVANDTFIASYIWTPSGPETVRETGIFDAPTNGNMLGRVLVSPAIAVDIGQQLNGFVKVVIA